MPVVSIDVVPSHSKNGKSDFGASAGIVEQPAKADTKSIGAYLSMIFSL